MLSLHSSALAIGDRLLWGQKALDVYHASLKAA